MAQFVRIGKHLVNLDQVTEIRDIPDDSVIVYFGAESSGFFGEEAQELRWFISNATPLNPEYQQCYACAQRTAKICDVCENYCCESHSGFRSFDAGGMQRHACTSCIEAQ